MTSVCTCCCVQVHTNVTAGKIFLSQISYSDSPKDSLFITLLYILLSVFDFIQSGFVQLNLPSQRDGVEVPKIRCSSFVVIKFIVIA